MGKLLTLRPAAAARAALIDEYGEAERLRDEFAPTEKRYQQLRKEIASWYEDKPADQIFTDRGHKYQIEIAARKNERTVDIAGVFKKLGVKKFLSICSLTIAALESALSKDEAEPFLTSARTGARGISSTPIIGAPVAPAANLTEPAREAA